LRRIPGPVAAAIGLILHGGLGVGGARAAADHLLITEFAVRPTDGEFIEIYNPTSASVDLSTYFVSDFVLGNMGDEEPESNYYHLVDGVLDPDPAFPNDFLARFPDGASLGPGESVVIALHDDGLFTAYWSSGTRIVVPDFELFDDGTVDGVPGMVDAGVELLGRPLIQSEAGLSNDREVIVLFHWDGQSDVVQDVDVVQWSNAGANFFTVGVHKTGVMTDGPDADSVRTAYLPDTPKQGQQLAYPGAHGFDLTVSRVDFNEGAELLAAGNGITGHDETSENLSQTWLGNTPHSIGSPGDYGPPSLVSVTSTSATTVEVAFSRAVEAASAEDRANYTLLLIQTPAGQITSVPVPVRAARLLAGDLVVELETDRLIPQALYELEARGVNTADGTNQLVTGSRAFFRGHNPGPGIELSVPKHPFVPHLEGSLAIRYAAPQGEEVLIRVYDLEGRELFVMAEETSPPGGVRTLAWDGRDHLRQRLPAGVYILHMELPSTGEATTAPLVVAAASEGALR
jgi:hypothetical protein